MGKKLHLPKIVWNRHKYQAGYVVGFGGSRAFAGAPQLTGWAALKAGAGIVRLFHPEEIAPQVLELIYTPWNEKEWEGALGKAQAAFVGPGLGRSKKTEGWLKKYLTRIECPCVVDADALLPDLNFPKGAVLTPHRGEMLRLLGLKALPPDEDLFAEVLRFCERKNVIVVLKGAPTHLFAPRKKPLVIARGDPGMAKAGTGDVLTGIIAALLAQGSAPYEGALLGVTLHAIAGEIAAAERTSYCVMARDLIEFLPAAFRAVQNDNA